MKFKDLDIDEVIKESGGFSFSSGLYKNTILFPLLQKIDGFVRYEQKSRDHRVKLLSYMLTDYTEDYMEFRRDNFSWYCSEFSLDVDSKKDYIYTRYSKSPNKQTALLIRFELDKPLGEQIFVTNDKTIYTGGYFQTTCSNGLTYYSLCNNYSMDEARQVSVSSIFQFLLLQFNTSVSLVIDNDAVCIYVYLDHNHFECSLQGDLKLLQLVEEIVDLVEKELVTDSDLAAPAKRNLPSHESDTKILNCVNRVSFLLHVVFVLLTIFLFIMSLVLLAKFHLSKAGANVIGMVVGLGVPLVCLIIFYVNRFSNTLLNRCVGKVMLNKIAKRSGKKIGDVIFKPIHKNLFSSKKLFKFVDFNYLKQFSIVCDFPNYDLYLYDDDCFTGALIKFKHVSNTISDVQLSVGDDGIKVVSGGSQADIEQRLKDSMMALLKYLRTFFPSIRLHVMVMPKFVHVYVPSLGYVDLTRFFVKGIESKLALQNIRTIATMINAADVFVDTYQH